MKVNLQKGGDDVEEVVTLLEVVQAIKAFAGLFDTDNDGNVDTELIPQEVGEILKTFTDDEQGNNDIENILVDIKNSLMYDEENTSISEISSRLEVIDTRLDKEFQTINYGLSFICTSLIAILSWKFFGWIMRLASV